MQPFRDQVPEMQEIVLVTIVQFAVASNPTQKLYGEFYMLLFDVSEFLELGQNFNAVVGITKPTGIFCFDEHIVGFQINSGPIVVSQLIAHTTF